MSEIYENQSDEEVVFERNDSPASSHQLTDLRQALNNLSNPNLNSERLEAARRVVNRLLDLVHVQDDINDSVPESIITDPNVIDDDMFVAGELNGTRLTIDISPVTITIDLSKSIKRAFLERKPALIRLMMARDMDLFDLEPNIMIMCVEVEMDELLLEMIDYEIPIHSQDYRTLYQLAALGKLELIKAILAKYSLLNLHDITMKICIQAVLNDHFSILEHFFTTDAFMGAPDILFEFMLNSIKLTGNVDIFKFFVNNGINIKLNNYEAVRRAAEFERGDIVKYFCSLDSDAANILTDEQKSKYGLCKLILMDQYIGIEISCNIYYDDILEGDTYLQCNNKLHHFKEAAWTEWMRKKTTWTCPHCFAPVKRILYVNKKKIEKENA